MRMLSQRSDMGSWEYLENFGISVEKSWISGSESAVSMGAAKSVLDLNSNANEQCGATRAHGGKRRLWCTR